MRVVGGYRFLFSDNGWPIWPNHNPNLFLVHTCRDRVMSGSNTNISWPSWFLLDSLIE